MHIEFDSQTPIYLQIADMIREAILAGDIPEEEAIPSVRQISVEQNLNPQTVLNATQELINDGLIEKRRGLGMFVKKGARKQLRMEQTKEFKQHTLPELIQQAKMVGIAKEELLERIEELYEENA